MKNSTKMISVFSLCLTAVLLMSSISGTSEGADNDQGEYSAYTYTFNFAFEGTNAQSILWDFGFNDGNGDPVTSTEWNPRGVVFPSKGTYTVTQTVSNTQGSYVSTLIVHVLGTPEVVFDTQSGSSIPMQYVKAGFYATQPTAPTKEGYDFGGWYKDANFAMKYDFATPVSQHITLYAKWTETGAAPVDDENGDEEIVLPIVPMILGFLGLILIGYGYSKRNDRDKKGGTILFCGLLLFVSALALYVIGVTDVESIFTLTGVPM